MKTIEEKRKEVTNQALSILKVHKGEEPEEAEQNADKAATLLMDFMKSTGDFPAGLAIASTALLFGTHQYEDEVRKLALTMTFKATQMAPDDIDLLHRAISNYVVGAGDFPEKWAEVVRISRKILAFDPNDVSTIITLYDYGTNTGELSLEEGIQLLERGAADHPTEPILLSNLAYAYKKAKEYAKAIEAFERYIKLEPEKAYGAKNRIKEIKNHLKNEWIT